MFCMAKTRKDAVKGATPADTLCCAQIGVDVSAMVIPLDYGPKKYYMEFDTSAECGKYIRERKCRASINLWGLTASKMRKCVKSLAFDTVEDCRTYWVGHGEEAKTFDGEKEKAVVILGKNMCALLPFNDHPDRVKANFGDIEEGELSSDMPELVEA
jgi:hypothetical protein